MEVSAMSYIAPHVQVKVEGEEGGEHVLHTSMDYGDLYRPEATHLYTDLHVLLSHCKVHSHIVDTYCCSAYELSTCKSIVQLQSMR